MAKSTKNIRETLIVGPDCQERFLPLSTSQFTFLREHGVSFAGMSTLKGQYEIRRNNNHAHLVLYTLGGKGWLKTDNKTVILKKGQVWISAEGNVQEYGLKGEYWEILWFDLRNRPPWNIIEEIRTIIRTSDLGFRFHEIMDTLMWESETNHTHASRIIQLCSEVILSYLEREFLFEYDESDYQITSKLHDLFYNKVKAQIRYPWTVMELCTQSELYVSATHFSRLCLEHLKLSPMKIVSQLRMEQAVELLHGSNYSILQISELVGYENYFAFSTAFKRRYGIAPRDYRKKLNQ
jgi:AraC-like DNA-binding protein